MIGDPYDGAHGIGASQDCKRLQNEIVDLKRRVKQLELNVDMLMRGKGIQNKEESK